MKYLGGGQVFSLNRRPIILVVLTIFVGSLFFGIPRTAQAAAFTSVTNGNWNDGATWGHASPGLAGVDYPNPAGGDTFTIAQGHEVTIPVGYSTKASGTVNAGLNADHGKLIINGSLRLDGNVVLNAYNELIMGAGSTLDLDNRSVQLTAASLMYFWLSFQGTSGSRVTVKSTTPGGTIATNDAGLWAATDINVVYTDFSNLGNCIFTTRVDATKSQNLVFEHNTVVDTGDFVLVNSGAFTTTANLSVRYNDFRGSGSGTNHFMLQLYTSTAGAPTGTRTVSYNTFSRTSGATNTFARFQMTNLQITYCVFNNIIPQILTSTGQNIDHSFVTNASENFVGPGGNSTNNYYYRGDDNPHTVNAWYNGSSDLSYNVIEAQYTVAHTDDGDHIATLNNSMTLNAHHNILIDKYSGVLANSVGSAPAGTYNFYNNTVYSNGTAYGQFMRNESGTVWAGTVNVDSNLVVDNNPATVARGVNFPTSNADQIDYTDYNDWYNVDDRYFQVSITGKAEGVDTGFGKYDINTNPQFVDASRNISTWDTSLGGAGTAASAVTELLKLNGYGGAYNSNYSLTNLLTYVRTGFTPTNVALKGTGKSGFDIGAQAVVPPPSLAEVSPVSNPTSGSTPDYTFSSDQAGTITYGGDCSSATAVAAVGNNTVTFNSLADGTHSNCTVTVTNSNGTASAALGVNSFTVDTTVPIAAASLTPTPAPASTYVFVSNLTPSSRSNAVVILQDILRHMGYLPPSVHSTGYYGPLTKQAVYLYQKAKVIVSSWRTWGAGWFGPRTRSALNDDIRSGRVPSWVTSPTSILNSSGQFNRDLYVGRSGNDVTALQQRLASEGFLKSKYVTGYYGPITKAAVILYQQAHHVDLSSGGAGRVGPLTRAVLNQ